MYIKAQEIMNTQLSNNERYVVLSCGKNQVRGVSGKQPLFKLFIVVDGLIEIRGDLC